MLSLLFILIISYFLGSIPFGKLMGLRFGIDIQQHGSGNIGFANCLRILGWKAALPVLAGDILKGFVPVILSLQLLPLSSSMFVALAAILGHVFPLWLRFKGGKGIATGLGVLFALSIPLAVGGVLIWLLLFIITRLNGLASILMVISLPILAMIVAHSMIVFAASLLLIGIWTHRQNIVLLLQKQENKLL